MSFDNVDAALGYLSKELIALGLPLDEYLERMKAAEAEERLPAQEEAPMNRPTKLPPVPAGQPLIHDAREHIARLVEPAHRRVLRKLLEEKSKAELIDAMFEMSHFSDLLDYFREELEYRNRDI